MTDRLVDAAEVARILGVSRQRVARLAAEAAAFPASLSETGGGRLWDRTAIEVWAVGHPDRGPSFQSQGSIKPGKMPEHVSAISSLAGDEARRLHHNWVGPDHLLLALLHPECPGAAGRVLGSIGITLEAARKAYVESMGDPFENKERWTRIPPATQLVLERANLKAVELRDEATSSQHVLLALIDRWIEDGTPAYVGGPGLAVGALRDRVVAMTNDELSPALPVAPPPPKQEATVTRRIRPPALELALSASGQDPRRRRPWGSAVFHDMEGQPIKQGIALRQYFVDRDGNPVLTTDGRPIHLLIDDDGNEVLDEQGQLIVAAVDIPPGSAIKATPTRA